MKLYFFACCMLLGVGTALIITNPLGKTGSIPLDLSVNSINKGWQKGIDGLSDLDGLSTPVDKPIDKPIDKPVDRYAARPSHPMPTQPIDKSFDQASPVTIRGSVVCPVKGYDAVNIRSSPDLDGKILTYALCNESIEIINRSNDVWTYIKYKNYIGYMYSDAVNTL